MDAVFMVSWTTMIRNVLRIAFAFLPKMLWIPPITLAVLLSKWFGTMEAVEDEFVNVMVENFNLWIKNQDFKNLTAEDKSLAIQFGVELNLVPLFFFPEIKNRLRKNSMRILGNKLSWYIKTQK